MAARLRHPNVVGVYDIVEEDDRTSIVMELVPYRSLRDAVRDDGPLSPAQAARVGLGVLAALRAAHDVGVVHRDVKPANILLGPEGRVVLTDFGIAKAADSPALTASGVLIGSPSYLAPERAQGQQSGAAADLWALGASLYAAVEGRPPFDRDGVLASLTAVVTDEPDPPSHAGPLWPVIVELLRKDPQARVNAAEAEPMLRRVADEADADDTGFPQGAATRPVAAAALPDALSAADGDAAAVDEDTTATLDEVVPWFPAPAQPAPDIPAGAISALEPVAAHEVPIAPEPVTSDQLPTSAEPVTSGPLAPSLEQSAAADVASVPEAAAESMTGSPEPAVADGETSWPEKQASGDAEAEADHEPPDASVPLPPQVPVDTRPARRRRLRPVLAALAVIVVAAVTAGVLTLVSAQSPDRQAAPRPGASTPRSPSSSAAASASGSPAATPSSSGSSAATRGGSSALPAGYYRFTNSTGFSIGVPRGWQISHVGHYVYIRDPADSAIFLLIDQSDQPEPNPLANWQQQAAARQSTYPDYHLIRLQAIYYAQAEKAADWEFTYNRDGIQVEVLNRNVLANAHHAYALYWSTPVNGWNAYYHYFQAFAATFKPASVNQAG